MKQVTDPYTGVTSNIPTFTATQTLSPAQMAIKKQSDLSKLNLGTLASEQSAKLRNYLNEPVNLNNEATEARLMELGRKRLDPMLAQRRASSETDLINRGIRPGSDNYRQAREIGDQGENDAYNQLLLTGRQQSVQEALTARNQPINEITALMSGSQVGQPNYVNPNMPDIPTTDTGGLINANYDQKLGIYNQQNAQRQNLLGGLFGLGSAFIKSDRRAKTEIKEVGKTKDGQPIFSYRYKAGGPIHIGLMAQEVEKKHPEAVAEFGGIKHVDYEKALEDA